MVSAYSLRDGRWLRSEPVAEGSKEIPAAQRLLARVEIEGSLVTADAQHTQTATARIVVQDRGADFLFTVKGNRPGIAQNVQPLYRSSAHGFPPSGPKADRANL